MFFISNKNCLKKLKYSVDKLGAWCYTSPCRWGTQTDADKLQQKVEKNKKSCWQSSQHMIRCKSCCWTNGNKAKRDFAHEPWQINSNATLKIPNTAKRFAEEFQRTKRFERTNPNKTVKSRNVCEANKDGKPDDSGEENKLFNMRVWSWLRMNAGGVPNTCKSNGLNET